MALMAFPCSLVTLNRMALKDSLPWSGFIDSRADEPVYLYADEAIMKPIPAAQPHCHAVALLTS